jgi:hypothetical protein
MLFAGVGILVAMVVVVASYVIGFGTLEQSWKLAAPGETLDVPLALEGGTEVQITLHADYIHNDNCRRMPVRVELSKGEHRSYKGDLAGFSWGNRDGGVSSAGRTISLRTIVVHEEGIDRLRFRYDLEPSDCQVKIDGLELQLRHPRL